MEAVLDKASLAGADLRNACLPEASLLEADLRGADLSGACLYGTKLRRAHLQGADLRMASLQGADLAGAGLQGADLRDGLLQGANFFDTHLQGACLAGAQLHGARSEPERSLDEQVVSDSLFRDRMRNRIGCQGDLCGATFEGGLAPADLEALLDDLPVEKASRLRERLEAHVDMPAGHEPPSDSGAVGGAYDAAEAEQWIAKYQDVMSEMPGTGRWGG